jgi:hypothetical protein
MNNKGEEMKTRYRAAGRERGYRCRPPRAALVAVASIAVVAGTLASAASSGAAAASSYVIVVVPPGGTQPSGNFNQVVPTLSAAKTAVEQNNSSGNVTVELTNGTYRLTSPLSFGPADGGQNGHSVTWEAYPGASPLVTGSEQVTNWALYNAGSNVWEANVGQGTNSRQLYVNGVEAPVAGSSQGGASAVPSSDWNVTSTGFTITNSSLQSELDNLPDQSQIEVEHRGIWTDHFCPVSSISGSTVSMQEPCWQNSTFGWDTFATNSGDFLENSLAFLTAPREWYLDSETGELYYVAPAGTNMSGLDVELPLAQSLIDISGSYSNPVRNLAFQGIQFSYTSWLGPSSSTGYADEQSNGYLAGTWTYPSFGSCTSGCTDFEATRDGWDEVPGAIQVAAASGIVFAGDTFSDLGSAGLGVGEDADANSSGTGLGAQDITIANNTISGTSADGITIGGMQYPNAFDPSSSTVVDQDIVVENNNINNVGTDYYDSDDILSTYCTDCVIAHNQIANAPYDGIGIGYGWGVNDPGGSQDYYSRGTYNYWPIPTTATTEQGTVVTDNVIHNTAQYGGYSCCAGPVYNLSADPGAVISNNYMYNNGPNQGGLYYDEGSRFITAYDNVIAGTNTWGAVNAFSNNNSDDDIFYNNWYNSGGASVSTGSPHYNVLNNNISVGGNNWPAGAAAVISQAGISAGLGYPAPTITTAPQATFTAGVPSSVTVQASGSPAPSLSESGPLPSGVNFTDNGNGTATISGTPAPGSAGSYAIAITASNGVGNSATQVFTLTVLAQAPASNTVTLTGRVTDSNGNPFSGVCVYLYFMPTSGSSSYSACTGPSGSYEFDGIVPGLLSTLDSYHYELEFVGATGTEWYDGVPGGTPSRSDAGALQLEGRLGTAVTAVNFVMPGSANGNGGGTTTTQPSSGGGFPSGYGTLKVANDSLCLDSFGNTTNAGAVIDQWACNGGSNQDFQFVPTSGGYGELQVESSGQDVSVLNSSTAQGQTDIVQEPVNGNAASQWLPEQQSDGSWQFKNQNSGLCLDVYGATSNQGQQLDQWPCKNAPGTNQDFLASATGPGTTTTTQPTTTTTQPTTTTTVPSGFPSGYHTLVVANDSLCLDSFGNTANAGAIIDQWACNGGSNQDFQFVPTSGGYGELQVESSGQDVTAIAEGSSSASAQGVPDIAQEPVSGTSAAQWRPEQQTDGSWQFKNQNSGLCLDVYGAGSNQGQQLDQWPCKNAPGTNQDFKA